MTERRRNGWSGLEAERAAWWTKRITGTALLVLAAVHLVAVHLSPVDLDYSLVVERWRLPAWRLFDLALLAVALAHGGLGLRTVLQDHIRAGMARTAAQGSLAVLAAAALVLGAVAVLAFIPVGGPGP